MKFYGTFFVFFLDAHFELGIKFVLTIEYLII